MRGARRFNARPAYTFSSKVSIFRACDFQGHASGRFVKILRENFQMPRLIDAGTEPAHRRHFSRLRRCA